MTLASKDPDVAAAYSIDWRNELVLPARRGIDVVAGQFFRYPHLDTGFYYEVTTAGRLAQFYPVRVPRVAAQTIQDGSAVLTCRHPDDSTLVIVSSAVWTPPSGLTLDSQSESGFLTTGVFSGGTDGEDYDVLCRMTPTSGEVREQSITIPVRAQ